jgi:hypothetical protein
MHHSPARRAPRETAQTLRRLIRWAARRRRAAAALALRGACYGAGTAAVSVIAVWVEQHL